MNVKRSLNEIVVLAMLSISMLIMAASAQDQPYPGVPYLDGQYPAQQYPPDLQVVNGQYPGQTPSDGFGQQQNIDYSTSVPSGAPVPVAPNNPERMGLQIPSEQSTSAQAPTSSEMNEALIPADQSSAFGSTKGIGGGNAQVVHSAASMMVVPTSTGPIAPNVLYIYVVPQTTASCQLYGWLPMWLQTSSSSPIGFMSGILTEG